VTPKCEEKDISGKFARNLLTDAMHPEEFKLCRKLAGNLLTDAMRPEEFGLRIPKCEERERERDMATSILYRNHRFFTLKKCAKTTGFCYFLRSKINGKNAVKFTKSAKTACFLHFCDCGLVAQHVLSFPKNSSISPIPTTFAKHVLRHQVFLL